MKTYFVQHAVAHDAVVDPDRSLTEAGQAQAQKVAQHLRQRGITLSTVFHSGKTRALQTAQIFAEAFGAPCEQLDGLNPNDDPQVVRDRLQQPDVMYVGHLPNIQRLVNLVITGESEIEAIRFSNAAVACVDIDQDDSRLAWLITPTLCE